MYVFRLSFNLLILVTVLMVLSNCSPIGSGLPTAAEQLAMENGKQSLVLLRIKCEFDDGGKVVPYFCENSGDKRHEMFELGVAKGPLVGGEVDKKRISRFLSPETCQNGWSYMMLEPGSHFFTFFSLRFAPYGYGKLRYLPRWQIDIPQNHPVVYIGSLSLISKGEERFFILPSNKIKLWEKYYKAFVVNEEELAKVVIDQNTDISTPITTSLMKRLF